MKQQLTIFVATWISQQPWIGWRGAANIEGSCEYLMQAAKTKVGWNYYPIIQWNYYAPLDYIEVQHKNISSRVISKKEQRDLVQPTLDTDYGYLTRISPTYIWIKISSLIPN